ncbi:MAG: TVP38/TMEM64 family protein [Candidatus Binatia bacterium]
MVARAAVVAVVVGALALWWSGWASELGDPERIRSFVADAGMLGPVVFVLVMPVFSWAFLLYPAVWAAVALWPLPIAYAACLAGCILACTLTYLVALRVGSEWAELRTPASIRAYQERLAARPFATIVILRTLFWANPFVDLLIALCRVPFRSYLVATAIGLAPHTLLYVLIAGGALQATKSLPLWAWGLVAVAVGAALFVHLRMKRRRESAAAIAACVTQSEASQEAR